MQRISQRLNMLSDRFDIIDARITQLEEPLIGHLPMDENEKEEKNRKKDGQTVDMPMGLIPQKGVEGSEKEQKKFSWRATIMSLSKDEPFKIIAVNFVMTFLFYKQLYTEVPVILSMMANGDSIYARVIILAIGLSPIVDLVSHGSKNLSWPIVLRKVFLIDAAFIWLSMVGKYAKKVWQPSRRKDADQDYLRACAQWVHEFHQDEQKLSQSLASEQLASMVVLAVQVFALFNRAKDYWPDAEEAISESKIKERFDLVLAITVSLFTIGVQRTRLDLAGSPFGSISFKENVPAWTTKQLDHFPVVSGSLKLASMTAAVILVFRCLEPFFALLAAGMLHASFGSTDQHPPLLLSLQHCQGVAYLMAFPVMIWLMGKRFKDTPWIHTILSGTLTFPGPLVMTPRSTSPAAMISTRSYYLCRCVHLLVATFTANAKLSNLTQQLPSDSQRLAWAIILLSSLYMLVMLTVVIAMFLCDITVEPPELFNESLGIAIVEDRRALPRPLEKFIIFFQSAYKLYTANGNGQPDSSIDITEKVVGMICDS